MITSALAIVYGDHTDQAYAAVEAGPHGSRLPDPVSAALVLGQSGVSVAELGTALEATARCRECTGWDVMQAAKFVATAAAIGNITGPSLLLLPNLARIATRG